MTAPDHPHSTAAGPRTRREGAPTARALELRGRRAAALVAVSLPAPGPGEALVRTRWSALSRGTERLVFEGRVPAAEHARMRAPFQTGEFPWPVRYGYMAVGRVEEGPPDLVGRDVFCLHPHQERFVVPAAALHPLPAGLPPRRAVLAANMETALNALWDAEVGPGDRIAVVGGGVVGLLVAYLAAGLPGAEVTVVDVREERAPVAAALGAAFTTPAGELPREADVVFHASATAAGLATALELAGLEATVVELSWYGEGVVAAPLGGAFHSRRLRILASQVGRIPPRRAPRWDHARRLAVALELLQAPALDALLVAETAFDDLPGALAGVLDDPDTLCHLVRYSPEA